jgi:GDP-L-fucose synthase
MNKNSKIFIAGHNGLVGSAVFRNLKKNGYKNLIVISKKKLDLKNSKKVNNFFEKKKIEYMVICAALAGGIVANSKYPVDFFNENILIQNSLLNAALKFKLKRTIFLGTSCIYPDKAKTPIKEDLLLTGKIHETNEAYAISKIAGIQLCKALYNQCGLDLVALMPTNIYGLNDRYNEEKSHVIPAMILKFLKAKKNNKKIIEIWGDGTPKREFLYSDDLAEAIRIVLNTSNRKLLKLYCWYKFSASPGKIIMCINTSKKVFHMIVSYEPAYYFRLLTKTYFMPLESKFSVNRDDLHDAIMFFKRMLKGKFKSLACKIRVMPGKIEISAASTKLKPS